MRREDKLYYAKGANCGKKNYQYIGLNENISLSKGSIIQIINKSPQVYVPSIMGQFSPDHKYIFSLLPVALFIHLDCFFCVRCRVLEISAVQMSNIMELDGTSQLS